MARVNVDVKLDRRFRDFFGPKAEKRFAFVVEKTLNRTGKAVQAAIRERVPGKFTVRQKGFIGRQVAKIEKASFASVRANKAYIEVAVGKKPHLLLADFEAGGPIPPWQEEFAKGFTPLPVIGGPARKTKYSKTPKRYRIGNMDFRKTTTRSGAEAQASRDNRFYVVPGVGVFERKQTALGSGTRLVYYFWPNLQADQRLQFVQTGRTVAQRELPRILEEEKKKTIDFARGRS